MSMGSRERCVSAQRVMPRWHGSRRTRSCQGVEMVAAGYARLAVQPHRHRGATPVAPLVAFAGRLVVQPGRPVTTATIPPYPLSHVVAVLLRLTGFPSSCQRLKMPRRFLVFVPLLLKRVLRSGPLPGSDDNDRSQYTDSWSRSPGTLGASGAAERGRVAGRETGRGGLAGGDPGDGIHPDRSQRGSARESADRDAVPVRRRGVVRRREDVRHGRARRSAHHSSGGTRRSTRTTWRS